MDFSIDIGGFKVHLVSGGKNRLDGGGMLGILPKEIWNHWYPADEKNRIALETHCLLVESESDLVLVESGCGNKLGGKERAFYSVAENDWIGKNLEDKGVSPADVTKAILSHLHTDHAGGVVTRDSQGDLAPTFPNAEVFVSEQEYETARLGKGITPNAYNPDNYKLLEESGRLRKVDSNSSVLPGFRLLPTPGHTQGHVSVLIEGTKDKVVFTGDLLPLARQVVPHFNMAYDTHPVDKAETKKEFFRMAREENWLLVLSHDPNTPVCRVQFDEEKNRYSLVDVRS
ncbi:MAG: MBL fold metallo-hydrolase [Candidatus Omnitrophica bacterium]|nr:MBL fold metallo-hydrolase [Candidatus Omnitrophota bacterium]